MALAAPRRRQKGTFHPESKLWANDQEKFGLKLMQKMGYEIGKGLGANNDGIIDPIKARLKMNRKGIGSDDQEVDAWLAHQDDFQAVLASLNVEHGSAEAQEAGKKSLEKLSKKSKKRVHYQKFTRGKDLANYSIDDLGCILGTKSEKLKTMQKDKKEKEKKSVDETTEQQPENKHGVVTLQGGNYHEYFQKKMDQLKAKGLPTFEPTPKKKKKESPGNSDEDKNNIETEESNDISPSTDDTNEEEPTPKKKKKSKKEKKEKELSEPVVSADKENIEESSEKSSKKSKSTKEEVTENTEVIAEEKTEKKKKQDKSREFEEEAVVVEQEGVFEQEIRKKKKNKKQDKEQTDETINGKKRTYEQVEQNEEELPKKRKKKNKKEKKCAAEDLEKSANESDKSS